MQANRTRASGADRGVRPGVRPTMRCQDVRPEPRTIRDFGATGEGGTGDTAAIQQAREVLDFTIVMAPRIPQSEAILRRNRFDLNGLAGAKNGALATGEGETCELSPTRRPVRLRQWSSMSMSSVIIPLFSFLSDALLYCCFVAHRSEEH